MRPLKPQKSSTLTVSQLQTDVQFTTSSLETLWPDALPPNRWYAEKKLRWEAACSAVSEDIKLSFKPCKGQVIRCLTTVTCGLPSLSGPRKKALTGFLL